MNEHFTGVLKTYILRYQQEYARNIELLTDLEKANYVVSGFFLEVHNYASARQDKELLKIIDFHIDRWADLENVKLPE